MVEFYVDDHECLQKLACDRGHEKLGGALSIHRPIESKPLIIADFF